jgi:Dihydrofolate reductase
MSLLKCQITTSLDGFVAGPNQSLEHPLGEGAIHLHDWALPTKTFRTLHGEATDGETGIDDDILREAFANIGATIMGRNMFSPSRGPWGENPWRGWWGEDPPFRHAVFVLTHHAREPLVMSDGTTFHFVTDGIHSALAQAKKAANGKDVTIGGGANVIQQYLAAGLLDEIDIHIVPLLLGRGARLLDFPTPPPLQLEPLRTLEGRRVSHLRYRIKH